ncbi:hypothetical protein N824_07885 [Sporocytophaga myxococcoides]|uniref:Probable sensor domain-containing protein n=2 Tax=Sporocytophaga myxococcoides TaxID=153721 RepID=A0A098LL81_9BACT|nr:hypothetical protein N824_07885 [Sporocytophaga myxococcoides]
MKLDNRDFQDYMSKKTTYKAASSVAKAIEKHFAHQLSAARMRGDTNLAIEPNVKMVETMIDTAFWASLRREEGNSTKISIAFLPPEQAGVPILFEQKMAFTAYHLTKLSLGVERPGVHLGVWHENDQLFIWGTTLKIPNLCFILDVSEPGMLVIKHRRVHGFGKFANVAVLIGDQVKIIDENSASHPDCPELLQYLLGYTVPHSWSDSMNVLVQLAVSMRAHRHGGSLLVVPSDNDNWRKSILHPIKYSVSPPYSGLSDLMSKDINVRSEVMWQGALRTEVETLAGLTAVDGATVISDKYELYAFGAKIGRSVGNARVEKVYMSEPIVGGGAVMINPSISGGTRHLSAAQFVYDQKNALAFVASQDGHFTIFTWSPTEEVVQAHKIDTLLL